MAMDCREENCEVAVIAPKQDTSQRPYGSKMRAQRGRCLEKHDKWSYRNMFLNIFTPVRL